MKTIIFREKGNESLTGLRLMLEAFLPGEDKSQFAIVRVFTNLWDYCLQSSVVNSRLSGVLCRPSTLTIADHKYA